MVDLSMPAVRVILNDFDLACRVDAKGRPCGTTARHYTGTLPFMALELLYNPGAMHLLRHDLGSLFYVAMWWAVKGTNEEEEEAAALRILQLASWNRGTFGDVACKKGALFRRGWKSLGIELSPQLLSNSILHALDDLSMLFVEAEVRKLQDRLRSPTRSVVSDRDHDSVSAGDVLTVMTAHVGGTTVALSEASTVRYSADMGEVLTGIGIRSLSMMSSIRAAFEEH